MDNVGDGSGGVGCGEATHILGSLRKLCIAFSGENCEVEDFGLDKGSEFHGLSSIAQKMFSVQYCLMNLPSND